MTNPRSLPRRLWTGSPAPSSGHQVPHKNVTPSIGVPRHQITGIAREHHVAPVRRHPAVGRIAVPAEAVEIDADQRGRVAGAVAQENLGTQLPAVIRDQIPRRAVEEHKASVRADLRVHRVAVAPGGRGRAVERAEINCAALCATPLGTAAASNSTPAARKTSAGCAKKWPRLLAKSFLRA